MDDKKFNVVNVHSPLNMIRGWDNIYVIVEFTCKPCLSSIVSEQRGTSFSVVQSHKETTWKQHQHKLSGLKIGKWS